MRSSEVDPLNRHLVRAWRGSVRIAGRPPHACRAEREVVRGTAALAEIRHHQSPAGDQGAARGNISWLEPGCTVVLGVFHEVPGG